MELKHRKIEIHNEEVREIMREIPGRLLRWGLVIIFSIFMSIIIGSYFFTYKEKVTAPLIITTVNAPAPIVAKASGLIGKWFVTEGQKVKTNDPIAYISNSSDLNDVQKLNILLDEIKSSKLSEYINKITLEEDLVLGEIQGSYSQFYRAWMDYKDYLQYQFLKKKIKLLEEQIKKHDQHFQLSMQQQNLMEKEMEISKKSIEKYEGVWNKGGLSGSQLEEAKSRYIQSERSYLSFQASIKSAEINLINQKRAMLDLKEQDRKNILQLENNIIDQQKSLNAAINKWQSVYMLKSPIYGNISLSKYRSKNQDISMGERLATVIPSKKSEIVCRAVISNEGIGKIKLGQVALIKLAGYPPMEYGMLKGKVKAISSFPEKEGYYVEISLNDGLMSSYKKQLKLVQDMKGTAEIITNEMRMIYRFINPLKMIFGEN